MRNILNRLIRPSNQKYLLPVTVAATVLLGACQSSAFNSRSNEIKGTPLVVTDKPNRCAHPYKAQRVRMTSLSAKAKRRLTYDYVHAIRTKIVNHWNKPDRTDGSQCKVRISQRPDGCVKNIHFIHCPDRAMQKTVSKAIRDASPLPRAPHPLIYDDKISLTFAPPRTHIAGSSQTRPPHDVTTDKQENTKSRQAKRR